MLNYFQESVRLKLQNELKMEKEKLMMLFLNHLFQ